MRVAMCPIKITREYKYKKDKILINQSNGEIKKDSKES